MDKHLVFAPDALSKTKPTLVVFLGGSSTNPTEYQTISFYAARLGYAVLDLSYKTGLTTVGLACGHLGLTADACYMNYRGESIFGKSQAYASGSPTYSSSAITVTAADSVVNRLVCAIQDLKANPLPGLAGYFDQFIVANASSPYPTTGVSPSYPNWSQIIIAGHSQGGGDAAFIGMKLPASSPVKRVVMFSAPEDYYTVSGLNTSASWITGTTVTTTDNFWGLRNDSEGAFGDFVSKNWTKLAGTGIGVNETTDVDVGAGNGSIGTGTPHRLKTTIPNSLDTLKNHNSTAADCLNIDNTCLGNQANVKSAWNYLLSGGYTSN